MNNLVQVQMGDINVGLFDFKDKINVSDLLKRVSDECEKFEKTEHANEVDYLIELLENEGVSRIFISVEYI